MAERQASEAPGPPELCSRFHHAVELIGRRWSGAIIQLLLQGPLRYGALRAAIPDINDRMLTERLREMEGEALIERHVIPDTPVRVEYQLTKKGQALERAMKAISTWAETWIPVAEAAAAAEAAPTRARKAPRKRKSA